MKTILIIEDNVDVLENITELLTLAGYSTHTAKNGKKGLEMALQYKPDLILCDIMMPELDGYGVLRALENNPEVSDIPFIYLSAKSKRSDFRLGMDLGADDYLTKPFTGDELLKTISSRLKKSQDLKSNIEHHTNDSEGQSGQFSNITEMIQTLTEKRSIKKFRSKDTLFMEGDTANYLYYISSGKIKSFKTNEYGKDYIIEIYKSGDFLCYATLLDSNIHKESAIAIEASEIIMIPKQDFLNLLFSNNRISMEFLKLISNNFSAAENKLLNLAYNSARKRLAEALLFISKKYMQGTSLEAVFFVQRENLSALAGLSPESVSRILTEFKEEGLVTTDNGYITISDIKRLENLKN